MSTFELITMEVTPDIAMKIRALADSGFFALKTGNCTANVVNGVIKSIKLEQYSYPQPIGVATTEAGTIMSLTA